MTDNRNIDINIREQKRQQLLTKERDIKKRQYLMCRTEEGRQQDV